MFVKRISELLGGFRQFLYLEMIWFLCLEMISIWCCDFNHNDKWSLNNYDAIEIKSKGFYASSVTQQYVQNSTSKLKLRRALFLLSVSRRLSHEKSCAFVGLLSITNMMVMQTLKRCIGWITISWTSECWRHKGTKKVGFSSFPCIMLYNAVKEKSDFSC